MFRRLAVALVASPLLALAVATPAHGYADSGANGRARTAPGQEIAIENCEAVVERQESNGVTKYSHALDRETALTGCDHHWQSEDD